MGGNAPSPWLALGALLAGAAVAAGAFGAHGLRGRLDTRHLELWETAARYLMYGALALMVAGLADLRVASWSRALVGPALTAGSLIFSGTVFALALGGPGWLGAVTPLGGVLLIAGLLALALGAWAGPGPR